MRRIALLSIGVMLAAASAAAQDRRGTEGPADPAVPRIELVNGGTARIEGDLGRLRQGARTIQLAEGGTMPGSSQMDRIACNHQIDVAGLDRSMREVLQRERLRPSLREISANQLILYTRAWGRQDRRQFYSYFAEVTPCTTRCLVTVQAHHVDAPYRNGVLFLNEARLEDDDVTAALVSAAQREFDRCVR